MLSGGIFFAVMLSNWIPDSNAPVYLAIPAFMRAIIRYAASTMKTSVPRLVL